MKSFQTAFMFVQAALFINPCVESLALLSLWTFSSVSFNIYDVIIILFLSLVYNMLPMSICLHRYFSHQAFQTNRFGQCMLAIIGTLANQGGVLWWSSIHRKHHKYCCNVWCQMIEWKRKDWFGFIMALIRMIQLDE
eukprot:730354_1